MKLTLNCLTFKQPHAFLKYLSISKSALLLIMVFAGQQSFSKGNNLKSPGSSNIKTSSYNQKQVKAQLVTGIVKDVAGEPLIGL
jgi:hypothetical protein